MEPLANPLAIRDYYRDPAVRAAMLQYCGAGRTQPPSAVFVAGLCRGASPIPTWDRDGIRVPTSAIATLWERECDVARSLWDRRHLVFLFELDYQNSDAPGEPFLHPADVFLKIEPTYRAARRILAALAIRPQIVMTGRGYQFTGVIPLDDPLVDRLAALSPAVPPWHDSVGSRLPHGVTAPMTAAHARAAAGLGRAIEYLANLVMRGSQPASPIPVVFNGTMVGTGVTGREAVSIDFSHVGDPLDTRHFRAAWSTYQFHRLRPDIVGEWISRLPALVALPRGRRSLMTLLSTGRGLAAGVRESRRQPGTIPNVVDGVERLRRQYQASMLAAFHRESAATPVAGGETRPHGLPPCMSAALERPNDLLLKPEHVQHLVRGLMARGWSPRAIAGLVQRTYEEDHQWGDRWSRLHPQTRAAFDVRVFAAMVATGLDALVDFNCVSAQEKGLCPGTNCQFDLRSDRDRLQLGWRARTFAPPASVSGG